MPVTNITPHSLSLVIPLYNELGNITPLLSSIHNALGYYPHPWELILVDDGSTDGSKEHLVNVTRDDPHIRVVNMRRNFGQTTAIQAGIDISRGDIIATIDGDLQNDPTDIPLLVMTLLQEDLDLVVGWRKLRRDNIWLRTIPSRIANFIISKIIGLKLHDYGCGLKVYRAAIIKQVHLYGEMHRLIPGWLLMLTTHIREVVVNHIPRIHGQSKYGISRVLRVIPDIFFLYFCLHFIDRPNHFFSGLGLISMISGLVLVITNNNFIGVLLLFMATQFMIFGIISEVIVRIFKNHSMVKYSIVTKTCKFGWHLPK